jgi:hypothetical protein
MFFYEMRLAFSIYLLFRLWYHMRLIDYFLSNMLSTIGSRILKLPVYAEQVLFFFPSTVHVHRLHIKPPPVDIDSRWEWEDIVTIDMIDVKFNFWSALCLYLLSYGELHYLESVYVHGLRFYVEGHRVGEDISYNVSLLGGESYVCASTIMSYHYLM